MKLNLVATSIFALGVATSAFAQSTSVTPSHGSGRAELSEPANSGPKYTSDVYGDGNGTHPVPMPEIDPTTTRSIDPSHIKECAGMPKQNSGVDTRGGQSGASFSDSCREYDN